MGSNSVSCHPTQVNAPRLPFLSPAPESGQSAAAKRFVVHSELKPVLLVIAILHKHLTKPPLHYFSLGASCANQE